jgi:hypothetical protein
MPFLCDLDLLEIGMSKADVELKIEGNSGGGI